MKYGIIFDLDGTLLDTIGDLAEAQNYALKKAGLSPIEVPQYKMMVGTGIRNLSRIALEKRYPGFNAIETQDKEKLIEAQLKDFTEYYSEHCLDSTGEYEGISELLSKLNERSLKPGILSNKADFLTKKIISHFFPSVDFMFVEGMNEKWPRKPDPSFVLSLCSENGISAENVIYIGDSGTDMKTAVNAGFLPVGVLWGFRGEDELKKNGAAVLCRDKTELLSEILNFVKH